VNRSVLTRGALVGVALAALTIAGCSSKSGTPEPSASTTAPNPYADLSGSIKGTGATFPNLFYQYAIEKFADVAPDLDITYQGSGSSAGKKDFANNLNDFAGSDSLVKAGTADNPAADAFYYIPTVAAPITVSYNLSGVSKLQLTPSTVAKIFSSKVTKWNDPAIAADNAGVSLPDKTIAVVHRSEGSGTTNNFTGFLDKAAKADWPLGRGDSVAWAASTQGGSGNAGVAQLIKQSDGAIGYVDFGDATTSQLTFASIKNKAGKFVAPTVDAATAALAGATVNADLSYDPLDATGDTAYPITAPTYLLVRPTYTDAAKGAAVKGFIKWLLTDGQALAKDKNYAKLPADLQQKALAKLDTLK
jgi:phosphate transport system substrate-binding protein